MLSKDFELHIIDKTKGFLSSGELDAFLSAVDSKTEKLRFSSSEFANLERIIFTRFNLSDFIKDTLKYEHHLEIVSQIAANSNYLTDVVVKSPGFLYRVFAPGYLRAPLDEEKLKSEILSSMMKYKKFDSKLRYFRRLKNILTLKIGVADFLGSNDFEKTVRELSTAAKVIASEFFNLCFEETRKKNGVGPNIKNDYVIAALGKLGGRELNYSSDIDLIFFFGTNRKTGDNKIDYYELLHEAIQLFTGKASEQTADGFIYRVDMRLRPDGKYSPLAKTYFDYLNYYETRGEDWERQMLLKLDFIGGDKDVYDNFSSLITPFLFRSSSPRKYLKQVLEMKKQIENEAGNNRDIKRYAGGIRDIEFSVQALQILYGKKLPQLRTGNTLEAIRRLKEYILLDETEASGLEEAYVFYRKIEHFLQLRNDAQTHTLPDAGTELERLSQFMNFRTANEFLSFLNDNLNRVREIFLRIVNVEREEEKEFDSDVNIDFIDRKRAVKNFLFISKGESVTGSKKFDSRTIKLSAEVLPLIKNELSKSLFPDLLLESLRKIIESVSLPSLLFSEMRNYKFLNLLFNSILLSDRFTTGILEHPGFIDDFLSRAAFDVNVDFEKISLEKFLFYLNLQFAHGLISADEFSLRLQKFYDQKIKSLICNADLSEKFFIAGLGSFGSSELTYASDLDLLIVAETESESFENAAADFLLGLQSELRSVQIDFRLRPEGESSRLIWGIKAYEKYLKTRASVWEFLSLTKLHFVSGDENLFERFKSNVYGGLERFNSETIRNESLKMYRKLLAGKGNGLVKNRIDLKRSHGFLTTIDFLTAAVIVSNRTIFRELIGETSSKKLETVSERNLISADILQAFSYYRRILLQVQSLFDVNNGIFPVDKNPRLRLSAAEDYPNINETLLRLRKGVLNNYAKFFEKKRQ